MSDPTKPQFNVGQIVCTRSGKQLPFRIIAKLWDDGWYYQWNRNNYANEGMLRALTQEEKGDAL